MSGHPAPRLCRRCIPFHAGELPLCAGSVLRRLLRQNARLDPAWILDDATCAELTELLRIPDSDASQSTVIAGLPCTITTQFTTDSGDALTITTSFVLLP